MITIEEATVNLRAHRAAASTEHVEEGRAWYRDSGRIVSKWARESGHDRETVAGVLASYSQNASWKANVTMARKAIFGDDTEIRGLSNVVDECEDILYYGTDPAVAIGAHGVTGLKRADFYRNLIGRHTYVTCDRWHIRAGVGAEAKLTPELRAVLTAATRTVARENGESASACQAVVWCAIRASTPAPARGGRTPSTATVA